MRLLPFVVALFMGLGSAVDAAAADLAVLPLAGVRPASERAALTHELRAELTALGFDVLSTAATDQVIVDAAALGTECAVTVSSCAVQLGGVAGVRQVLVGAVEGSSLVLRVLDVASEREGAKVAVSLDAPRALRLAAVRLMRPSLDAGRLAISVDVSGAAITVDGELRGTSPLPPLTLPSGRHDIFVTHVDHDGQSFVIDIVFDQTATLDVTLAPGQPGRRRPSVGASVGAGPIVVLDVLSRPSSNLTSAVITTGLIEVLRRQDERVVATPTDLFRLFGEDGLAALRACDDDDCLSASLGTAFSDADIVVADVIRPGPAVIVRARRISVQGGVTHGAEAQIREGQSLSVGLHGVLTELFPEVQLSPLRSPLLDQRLEPPPLPMGTVIVAGAVCTLAGVGALAALAGAGGLDAEGQREDAAVVTTIGVVSAGVAGVALLAAVAMSPFVDWMGVNGENALLLEEAALRPKTRRHRR